MNCLAKFGFGCWVKFPIYFMHLDGQLLLWLFMKMSTLLLNCETTKSLNSKSLICILCCTFCSFGLDCVSFNVDGWPYCGCLWSILLNPLSVNSLLSFCEIWAMCCFFLFIFFLIKLWLSWLSCEGMKLKLYKSDKYHPLIASSYEEIS